MSDESPVWRHAPGHFDGDGCTFPQEGHMIRDHGHLPADHTDKALHYIDRSLSNLEGYEDEYGDLLEVLRDVRGLLLDGEVPA